MSLEAHLALALTLLLSRYDDFIVVLWKWCLRVYERIVLVMYDNSCVYTRVLTRVQLTSAMVANQVPIHYYECGLSQSGLGAFTLEVNPG